MDKHVQYIKLKREDVANLEYSGTDEIATSIIRKMYAYVSNYTDKVCYEAIIKWCREEGYTDLFLIDEEFVKTAIENELKRRKL